MWLILPVLIVILTCCLLLIVWKRRRLYLLSWQLPGPLALPIIGCGLNFIGDLEEIFSKTTSLLKKYPKPMRLWLGPKFSVVFSDPDHIEKILSSTKITYKHEIYDFFRDYVGDGLINNSGPEWKRDRKIIQPIFNMKFVVDSMEVYKKHNDILMKKLQTKTNGTQFDVIHLLHDCYGDIITELLMGYELGAQQGKNRDYTKATVEVYDIISIRFLNPWYYFDFIFNRTSLGKKRHEIAKITSDFAMKTINNVRNNLSKKSNDIDASASALETIIARNNGVMSDKRLVDHALTLYNASEDTMTSIAAFTCVCLGIYPQYQQRVVDEIRTVIGEKPRQITYDDLLDLKYLEMCIKETLRLFPIAPYIMRKVTEEFTIDKWVLPVDSSVLLPLFIVHRDASLWQYPEEYYPDHFLPEAVEKRHPFAYIPFSSGPRGCIGKTFAYAGLKIILANILQKFTIESDMKIQEIRLKADVSIRSIDGYNIRIKNRIWDKSV